MAFHLLQQCVGERCVVSGVNELVQPSLNLGGGFISDMVGNLMIVGDSSDEDMNPVILGVGCDYWIFECDEIAEMLLCRGLTDPNGLETDSAQNAMGESRLQPRHDLL